MSYKPNFKIKHRDRIDSNKNQTIKDTYDRMSKEKGYYSDIKVIKEPPLRKDETFVLMFRNFIFFDVKRVTYPVSDKFILENYVPVRDPNTGDIVSIKSTWDGESFTYEDSPSFFDKVAKVFVEERINECLGRNGGIK